MDVNKELINKFYTAFTNRDAESMIECYHADIEFEDPAFGRLKGNRAKSMWKMLVGRLNETSSVEFKNVEASETEGSANWVAKYNYGPKGRPVVNNIQAKFLFRDGKIIEHIDDFDMWTWSKQALGMPGLLMGWSGFMKSKIQQTTNSLLDKYMEKK